MQSLLIDFDNSIPRFLEFKNQSNLSYRITKTRVNGLQVKIKSHFPVKTQAAQPTIFVLNVP